jgi:uncharacterized protein (DUF1778 family)
MSIATEEIKFRLSVEAKSELQLAAETMGIGLSQFLRQAAAQLADEVLEAARLRQITAMPPIAFDELVAALDDPGKPNRKLLAAARRRAQLDLD